MLKDATLVVQEAIRNALLANTYISENSIPVLGMVPKGTAMPYILIGEQTAVDYSTKGLPGQEIMLMVHTWDQDLATTRLKTMMASVIEALHEATLTFTDPDFKNANMRWVATIGVYKDSDGMTVHGVQKFRIVVQNT